MLDCAISQFFLMITTATTTSTIIIIIIIINVVWQNREDSCWHTLPEG